MRPQKPVRDLSQQQGNPTHALQQAYQQLMAIEDPTELAQAAVSVVKPLVGHGMSDQNYKKFILDLRKSASRGLTHLQSFLTNFILAGSGLRTESNAMVSIASMITEDVNDRVYLTPSQKSLKALVEHYGFHVVLIDE